MATRYGEKLIFLKSLIQEMLGIMYLKIKINKYQHPKKGLVGLLKPLPCELAWVLLSPVSPGVVQGQDQELPELD